MTLTKQDWILAFGATKVQLEEAQAEFARLRAECERLRAALEFAHAHVDELCDAWERGAVSEHDGKGGLRSNRNAAVEMKIREVLKGSPCP